MSLRTRNRAMSTPCSASLAYAATGSAPATIGQTTLECFFRSGINKICSSCLSRSTTSTIARPRVSCSSRTHIPFDLTSTESAFRITSPARKPAVAAGLFGATVSTSNPTPTGAPKIPRQLRLHRLQHQTCKRRSMKHLCAGITGSARPCPEPPDQPDPPPQNRSPPAHRRSPADPPPPSAPRPPSPPLRGTQVVAFTVICRPPRSTVNDTAAPTPAS